MPHLSHWYYTVHDFGMPDGSGRSWPLMSDGGTPLEETEPEPPLARIAAPSDIVHLVRTSQLDNLIGARETDQVDFKSDAYDLDRDRSKHDLIADVAAFANSRGGVLMLGVETTVHPNERVEVASRICGYRAGKVVAEQYRSVLRDRIAPLVRDIRFFFADVESRGERPLQVAAIEVAAQRDREKPFIADRLVDDNDQRVTHAIGWPERSGDSTFWHPKERIQQLISSGLRAQTPAEQTQQTDLGPIEDSAVAWEAAGVSESAPRIAIQIRPISPSKGFDDFFGADAQALRQWRPIRASGFGFDLGWHHPEPRGNRFVATDTENALILSRSGIVTLASSFTTTALLWGSRPPDLTINPFALTEWVTEGVRLAYSFVGPRLAPSSWAISVEGKDLQSEPPVKIRHPRSAWFSAVSHATTTPAVSFSESGTGDWEADSYRILVELIGGVFGLPAEWVFGADPQTGRVDLRSIDRYQG